MKAQQPDNFFREKLADYQRPAPKAAWDRIEASLDEPKKKFVMWKIAASLIFISIVGYTLWIAADATDTQVVSNKVEKKVQSESPKDQPEPTTTENENINNDAKATQPPLSSNPQPLARVAKKSPVAKEITSSEQLENTVAQRENLQPVEPASPESVEKIPAAAMTPVKKSSSITITFTTEETDKYLDKSALAEATSKEQKSSTFKKFLKKANDLKSNQDPFGDLREKKNEILALNFRNEKRGQNK